MTIRANYEQLRFAGPAKVRQRLEALVNDGLITLAGAQKLYLEVFHLELRAVPEPSPRRRWLVVGLWVLAAALAMVAIYVWSRS